MLLVVLLTAGLVVWAVAGGGGDSTASMQQSGQSGQQPAGPGPAEESRSARSSPTPTETVTVTATPTVTVTKTQKPDYQGRRCRKVVLRLAVQTSKKAYGKGQQPAFKVRVAPKKRCWFDPDTLKLSVTSGTDHIWSSKDCTGRDRRPRYIGPKRPYKGTTTWQRVRSNPAKCGKKTAAARPGWYVLKATLADDRTAEAVFRLTRGGAS